MGVGLGVNAGVLAEVVDVCFGRLTANRTNPAITRASITIMINIGGLGAIFCGVFPAEYTGPYTGGLSVGGNIVGVGASVIVSQRISVLVLVLPGRTPHQLNIVVRR